MKAKSKGKVKVLPDDQKESTGKAKKANKSVPINEVISYFDRVYPDAKCGLNFNDPYQLLVATVLSAQCTDKRVNLVTPKLFAAFPDPNTMAQAELGQIEELVKTCGLYRAKAANISKLSRILAERFESRVPSSLEELISLPGVGRKTANVVLGNAFGIPGLTVDTHLGRVSRRLGLSSRLEADMVEQDLMKLVPKKIWTSFSHQAINHGRTRCLARKPTCSDCGLLGCPSREEPAFA
ncbi:MAG: endonuclease III [Deltaproteobacteria bacterium]|jgi:endonuclease-3|nr:endonuclease III [Deltaproteobacteria bacterium]